MALRTATSLTIARWYRRIATPGPLHLEPLQDAGYRSRRTVNYAHVMSRAPNQSKAIPIISIVDDDDGVREATASLVRSLGYRASTFASADEFLKSEQVSNTSCLITDVRMPGMSGIDLQDRLIADGHRIPIIFIT